MPSAEPEVDLLACYRAGDAQAFRRLVDLYRDKMLQFFFRLCQDRDRAEDLAQDLFVKLVTGISRYREQGKMSVFIYRVATNLWIDHYRQSLPRPRFCSYDQIVATHEDTPSRMDFAGKEPTPAQSFAAQDQIAAIRQAIGSLTEPHRCVLELAVFQQRPYAEIGALLGIPLGTVKSRVHSAVAALKELLGVPGHGRGRESIARRRIA